MVNSNATKLIPLTMCCGALAVLVKMVTGKKDVPGGDIIITVDSSLRQKIKMIKNEVNNASPNNGIVIFLKI